MPGRFSLKFTTFGRKVPFFMLVTSIVLFALAALQGAFLLVEIVRKRNTKKLVVFGHGFFAVLGLGLLLYHTATTEAAPWFSISLFLLAALLGVTLLVRDLKGKPGPRELAFFHGTIAFLAFVLLLSFFLRG